MLVYRFHGNSPDHINRELIGLGNTHADVSLVRKMCMTEWAFFYQESGVKRKPGSYEFFSCFHRDLNVSATPPATDARRMWHLLGNDVSVMDNHVAKELEISLADYLKLRNRFIITHRNEY